MDCETGIHLPEKYRPLYQELLDTALKPYTQPRETISIPYLLKGRCRAWAHTFQERFPELEVRIGFYGHGEHFWCTEPDGTIVDPTVLQFYEQVPDPAKYRLFDEEADKIYLGKCMNCGWEIYGLKSEGEQSCCRPGENDPDQDCQAELERYYNSEVSRWRRG